MKSTPGWKGLRQLREVSLGLQGELQAATGDLGCICCVKLNTFSIYCTQTMAAACIKEGFTHNVVYPNLSKHWEVKVRICGLWSM